MQSRLRRSLRVWSAALLCAALPLAVLPAGPVVPAGASSGQADGAGLDPTFGDGGAVTIDTSSPLPVTLVATNPLFTAAAVGDRFGFSGTGRSGIGFNGPARAHAIADGGLVVGGADGDFGLAKFGGYGAADFRFGQLGHETIDFGGPSEAWAAVHTDDNYGWFVAGTARPGGSSRVALAKVSEFGQLDPSFGNGGTVTADVGPGDDEVRAIVPTARVGLVVAGRSGGAAMVARFDVNGILDKTFGVNGVARLDLSAADDVANGVALDSNYGIMVTGRAGSRAFVSRLTSDGELDPKFGTAGTVFIDFGGRTSEARGIRTIGRSAIVVGVTGDASNTDGAIARVTGPGALDPAFGQGGVVVADFGSSTDELNDLNADQSTNTVTAVGGTGTDGVEWHLNVVGQPDTSFGPDGITFDGWTSVEDAAGVAAVGPDGRIVVASTSDGTLCLTRLEPDGARDLTFGDGGTAISGLTRNAPVAVAVAPDGGIVVRGSRPWSWGGDSSSSFLARFRPDGHLDTSFAGGGAMEFGQTGSVSGAHSLLIQPDGRIVTAGGPALLSRFLPDGRPDPTFGDNGVLRPQGTTGRGVALSAMADGTFLVAASDPLWSTTDVARVDADGHQIIDEYQTGPGMVATDLVPTPDGGAWLSGSIQRPNEQTIAVIRLRPDLQPDSGFGDGGTVEWSPDARYLYAPALAALPGGRVALSFDDLTFGELGQSNVTSIVTALDAHGDVDESFGDSGSVELPGTFASTNPLIVAKPGRLLAITATEEGRGSDVLVAAIPTQGGGAPQGPGVGTNRAGSITGYWMTTASGQVFAFGNARNFGDVAGKLGPARAVDLEPTPGGDGYWILDSSGAVYSLGDASFHGRAAPASLAAHEQATSISATPDGGGYWIFTSRGRVLAFGDAAFLGDMSATTLNGPVLGSVATPSGKGYYMVAADGGIFAFGDATFAGSMGGRKLNAPVTSLVPDSDGHGYWLVASDGGIFAFDAPFRGSMGGTRLNKPVSGMVRYGDGYLMVGADGGIFNFSSSAFAGSLGDKPPASPVVAVAAR